MFLSVTLKYIYQYLHKIFNRIILYIHYLQWSLRQLYFTVLNNLMNKLMGIFLVHVCFIQTHNCALINEICIHFSISIDIY